MKVWSNPLGRDLFSLTAATETTIQPDLDHSSQTSDNRLEQKQLKNSAFRPKEIIIAVSLIQTVILVMFTSFGINQNNRMRACCLQMNVLNVVHIKQYSNLVVSTNCLDNPGAGCGRTTNVLSRGAWDQPMAMVFLFFFYFQKTPQILLPNRKEGS